MQVTLEDVLNEYRDHSKQSTDDLLMHKAALKSLERRVAELETENAQLRTEAVQEG
ncbi:hypothetical protein ACPYPG_08180 [Streptomyces sp. FR-108]|uniref:hypothetical protein n=1 Tax=Streptomyces sp. FR-108 TaxID=3416665 RepID=UPI003CE84286